MFDVTTILVLNNWATSLLLRNNALFKGDNGVHTTCTDPAAKNRVLSSQSKTLLVLINCS